MNSSNLHWPKNSQSTDTDLSFRNQIVTTPTISPFAPSPALRKLSRAKKIKSNNLLKN